MGYSLNITQADAVLEKLRKDYRVFAPRRFPKQGRYSDTDIVRYAEVERFSDIVWDVKSDYPAKEVLTPIQQTIFYFTEDEYRASKVAANRFFFWQGPAISMRRRSRPGYMRATAAMMIFTIPG